VCLYISRSDHPHSSAHPMTTKGLKVVMALRTHWTTQGLKA
jgi:hypothetical protein